ncbi:MAG: ATPase, T2SS/T4P/T4SS family [Lachnospiraceae bacterium]|nr:ATPase, T2SS/T4P/T4SS family [Lachnospiraceae bacterium]
MRKERKELSESQYGPFWDFIKNDHITDVDYNGKELWVRDIYNGRYKIEDPIINARITEKFINDFSVNVANLVGKNFTPTDNNVIEAEINSLRITVIHSSVAMTGTCVCIRKTPPVQRITIESAVQNHYCEEKVLHLLANCVKAKLNIVFCGEPGVGKTECAKFLTSFIPKEEKIVTIEDTSEIHYRKINPGKDCVELCVNEYFTYNDAMSTVLRITPNRVMLSEARSVEVKQLVECWTAGITGFTTLHTDDVRKIPDRILNMMPSRQDADRLENDVYTGLDVGILLDMCLDKELKRQKRYIRQVGFFDRDMKHNRNSCIMVTGQGELLEDITLPEDIQEKMQKSDIKDPFYNEEVDIILHPKKKK